MTCCKNCFSKDGCSGGRVWDAWKYFKSDGVVSGGLYGTHETCQPYLINPLKKNDSKKPIKTPPCSHKCDPNFNRTYEQDKYYALDSNTIQNQDVRQIQMEILKNGPVVGSIRVYEDFYNPGKGWYLTMIAPMIKK